MSSKMKSEAATASATSPTRILPKNWPDEIQYLTDNTYSAGVTSEQKSALTRTKSDDVTWIQISSDNAALTSPNPLVEIHIIADEKHPANGQRGLFAVQDLAPDQLICIYLGHIHTNSLSDTDPHSDYDLSLDRDIGLSVDGARSGNESRHANDYRGIAERPNAEFRDCYVQVPCPKRKEGMKWERRVGIFVLSAGKAGKRKGGIKAGDEVLVNYGKSFWEARRTVATFRKDEVMMRIAQLALDA